MLKDPGSASPSSATDQIHAATSISRRIFPLAPGVAAGTALGVSDVLAKLVLATGCDVLTMLSFRSVVGLAFVASWLRFGRKPSADARVRWVSMGIGIVFAGLIFCLFKAIAAIDVPTAILSYFTYPLLTGLIASFAGLDLLRWKGVLCAIVAFFGLAIMIGAHPAGLAFIGVAYALGAACCRTAVLLATRAYLVGADARLTTWYSMLSSTAVFVAVSLGTQTWHPPQTAFGWIWLVALSLATTAAILFVFVSTMRIGPFRTALIMHLEPLTAMILSALLLSEAITPLQGLGSAVMLTALIAFQLWR
ncbi:MAG TPA: DMT family transporter [Xanthobacteraceae bacterium]|nr:DMT family transporter [Xanthobacteraceae bacterium]